MVEEAAANLVTKLDLHTKTNGVVKNGSANQETPAPPDGGLRAWLIMLGSFICNGILFGCINSYSLLYSKFHQNFEILNITNPSGKAALVGSLSMGTTFFISPVSGVITDYFGIRATAFLGGLISSGGMFLASFCTDNFLALCFTYGVMYGLGGALTYTPSLAVLGHYFSKYLGIVNGLVTAGSSLFTITMPFVISALLKHYDIVWTLRILSAMSGCIMICAILFKPIKITPNKKKEIALRDIFNLNVLSNPKYLIWTAVIALSLFGYFVPYVYINVFVENSFGKDYDAKFVLLCIGVSSGLGRLMFGYIGDLPKVNRIMLQQLAFLVIGLLTILLPFSSGSFTWLLIMVLIMGLFDGCFITLLGPIAFDICGRDGGTQAIGFLLGICAIPLTLGPYVAGIILDQTNNYTICFILAGIPPVIGSVAMFLIRCVKKKKIYMDHSSEPLKNGKLASEAEAYGEEDRVL